jgi:hypothetical protein
MKREEIAAREQEIAEKFNLAEKQRFDIEKKLSKLIDDRASSVQVLFFIFLMIFCRMT